MSALVICAIALAFGFFGSMPLAGPIAIMVLSRAAAGKLEEAIRVALGAAAAEGIYAGLAFWGFATFLARHAIVVPISHGVTAIVLVALGVRFVFWKLTEREDHRRSTPGGALLGFTVSALNPTLFVTWSAAVAFLYSKGLKNASAVYAIPFGVCAGTGVASWFLALGWVLKRYEGKLPRRVLTGVVRTLGLALVGLGVWSGVQLAKWLEGDRKMPSRSDASLGSPCGATPGSSTQDRACRRATPLSSRFTFAVLESADANASRVGRSGDRSSALRKRYARHSWGAHVGLDCYRQREAAPHRSSHWDARPCSRALRADPRLHPISLRQGGSRPRPPRHNAVASVPTGACRARRPNRRAAFSDARLPARPPQDGGHRRCAPLLGQRQFHGSGAGRKGGRPPQLRDRRADGRRVDARSGAGALRRPVARRRMWVVPSAPRVPLSARLAQAPELGVAGQSSAKKRASDDQP